MLQQTSRLASTLSLADASTTDVYDVRHRSLYSVSLAGEFGTAVVAMEWRLTDGPWFAATDADGDAITFSAAELRRAVDVVGVAEVRLRITTAGTGDALDVNQEAW